MLLSLTNSISFTFVTGETPVYISTGSFPFLPSNGAQTCMNAYKAMTKNE